MLLFPNAKIYSKYPSFFCITFCFYASHFLAILVKKLWLKNNKLINQLIPKGIRCLINFPPKYLNQLVTCDLNVLNELGKKNWVLIIFIISTIVCRCCNEMQMICSKSESSVSFSFKSTFTDRTNLRLVKAVRRDERFLLQA